MKEISSDARVLLSQAPYADKTSADNWATRGIWPCRWIGLPEVPAHPSVTAYRRSFTVAQETVVRIHVSADERYELFLDGTRIGRGSERGDADHWYFETYALTLAPGEHLLVARVWSLGPTAAYAQRTVSPGFLLSPDDRQWVETLGTGVAPWEATQLGGYEFTDPDPAWGTGPNVVIHGSQFSWGVSQGAGEGWELASVGEIAQDQSANPDQENIHRLCPATLPPMYDVPWSAAKMRHVAAFSASAALLETNAIPILAVNNLAAEQGEWQNFVSTARAITIPPHTGRRILIDLTDYVCAYPELVVSGGRDSRIRVNWQEALYEQLPPQTKGDRDAIEGKYFVCAWWAHDGVGDTFLPDGGNERQFDTLWWQCGRYVEIVIQTAGEALTLNRLTLHETRYPLEMESRFAASDTRLMDVMPLAVRSLQMCAHETYMDCPFYEQLQYVGDTRLEALTTYTLTSDDRLPRKALTLFDASRLPSGLTQSRYPSRVRQVIPPFSLWWIGMVHDYALWRDDTAFVHGFLPGVRGVLDAFSRQMTADGLLAAPDGWNFIDWVPGWEGGMPPDGAFGVSGPVQWQLVLALNQVADLEEWAGEPELAARARRLSEELTARAAAAFWSEPRGLLADDLAQTHFSQHSQCLALLGGRLSDSHQAQIAQHLWAAPDLALTTIYFTHYLFETCYLLGRPDALLNRLNFWFDLARRGLKTTVEMPEPTRSDCHAWGAHPIYHYFASLLGIRPSQPGFSAVRIAPQLGPLHAASGSLPHPRGSIRMDLRREGEQLRGLVTLPEGLPGTFHWAGQEQTLAPGTQEILLVGTLRNAA